MTEQFIGAGGWAYFQIPGIDALDAYSKAFNFVELNSSFYEIPSLKEAEAWRKRVSERFRFVVRVHKSITHEGRFLPSPEICTSLEKVLQVCRALEADILHFQIPSSFKLDSKAVNGIEGILGIIKEKQLKFSLEVRSNSRSPPSGLIKVMQDHGVIHCVDLLKGESPAYPSDTLYTRVFGKGEHNIYPPEADELKYIQTFSSYHRRACVAFHGARMYSDAARLTVFNATGKFPMITKYTGIESLASVLKDDTKFPTTKESLLANQGWKLFDLQEDRRVRAEYLLQFLPEGTYSNLHDVIQLLYSLKGGEQPVI